MNERWTTTARSVALTAALLAALAGCGSDDDVDATSTADGGATESDGSEGEPEDATDAAPEAGAGTGTLTMADGTVYELEMSTCETSDTNPSALPLTDGYDLSGRTADGAFAVYLGRAGFDDDGAVQVGSLEGDFDENGKNAGILYSTKVETLDLTVDGGNVTGTFSMRQIIPGGPHGEEIDATLQVNC